MQYLTISNIWLSFAGGMPAAGLFSTNTKPLFAAASRICWAAEVLEGDMSITGIWADCLDILKGWMDCVDIEEVVSDSIKVYKKLESGWSSI